MGTPEPVVFLDVDTQNDFIREDGALSVPGAMKLIPIIARLTEVARNRGIRVFGSVDRHFGTTEYRAKEGEMSRWGGPFPDHCMDGAEGQRKVPATAPRNPLWVPNSPEELPGIADRAWTHPGEVIFEKQSYDVFHNPNAVAVLGRAGGAVVYGVATDYCVRAAALGLRRMGVAVSVVRDAIAAVNVNPGDGDRALREMEEAGVRLATAETVIRELE
jgi:nicotinamidase/pyrazinamidase